ncbi:MAG: chemotaxis protein CheW [Bacteroidetes bacterium]|nr:chemotaxis protein CheW [Bacteroidota bacterium]
MENLINLVLFSIDNQLFAVSLSNVLKVMAVVEITPLPESPNFIRGVINMGGRIIPVADIRLRVGINEKDIQLSDQIIIATTPNRLIGLLVDSTEGIKSFSEPEIIPFDEVMPTLKHINGIAKIKDDIIYITNLDVFLSLDEEVSLDNALK